MNWYGRVCRDALERLGYDEERLRRDRRADFTVQIDPEMPSKWIEFWMGEEPERKVRYALRPCADCGDGMVFTLVEPS